jgi:membrane protease YdiL (CAAX protease family)
MNRSPAGSLIPFFLLTYAASWIFFVAVAATSGPTLGLLPNALVTLGAYMPSVVALALTWRREGEPGVRRLVDHAFRWNVAVRWYVFALGYTIAIKLTAALLLRALIGAWPRFETGQLALIPFAIAFSTPFQAGEEIGWRGYALPRLAARFGLASASILLGVVWACWHLPLFFARGADTYHQSFWVYAAQVTAISVIMAYLYARTRGSLLIVMLFHAAVNNTKDIVPAAAAAGTSPFGLNVSPVSWIGLALQWIVATILLMRMPKSVPED